MPKPKPKPKPKPHQPCWYCMHWAGPCWGDPGLADCRRGGRKSCKAEAAGGCSHWERVPGVDDDGWAPVALVRPMSPERRQADAAAILLARKLVRATVAGTGAARPAEP